jgi:hypothetical protein
MKKRLLASKPLQLIFEKLLNIMRIYIPIDITGTESGNPYDTELVKSLERRGHQVDLGKWRVSYRPEKWQIVHIQWPEYLIDSPVTSGRLSKLVEWIRVVKSYSKIVLTLHNLAPHYKMSPLYLELYQKIFELVDGFIHMGPSSKRLMIEKYDVSHSTVEHVEIPHGNYNVVGRPVDKLLARNFLGIDNSVPTVLVVGGIRHNEELKLVFRFNKLLRGFGGQLLYAGKSIFNQYRFFGRDCTPNLVARKLIRLGCDIKIDKTPGIRRFKAPVERDRLRYLLSASDILLIPRVQILNSGNVPLGFSYSNVVLGPNVGNVGAILQRYNNPVYDPASSDRCLREILKKAIDLSMVNHGHINKQASDVEWDWDVLAESLESFYKKICDS